MGILWYACAAPIWAMALWPLVDRGPTHVVECSVSEFFPGGAKTPVGSFTVVLREGDKTDLLKGWTRLEGTWRGDPTLSVRITSVDRVGGRFPLDMAIKNSIEVPDHEGGVSWQRNSVRCHGEARDDFVIQLAKADDFGGYYEFEFQRKSICWYRALLP